MQRRETRVLRAARVLWHAPPSPGRRRPPGNRQYDGPSCSSRICGWLCSCTCARELWRPPERVQSSPPRLD